MPPNAVNWTTHLAPQVAGPDTTVGGLGIDVTHSVAAAGTWSFNWHYSTVDTKAFDHAYYLLNGIAIELAGDFLGSGSESIPVVAGDVIGWRVDTDDGIFGPGVFTITEFQIPAPGALTLLSVAGLAGPRRRRA